MIESIENDLLPNALMIGVDYELFWTLNPKSLQPFVKAFTLKQKHEDVLAWKYGAYVRMAIASCFGKNVKYPDSPMMKDNKPQVMSGDEIKNKMMIMSKIINTRFGKEESDIV